jgi:hypothetical protein
VATASPIRYVTSFNKAVNVLRWRLTAVRAAATARPIERHQNSGHHGKAHTTLSPVQRPVLQDPPTSQGIHDGAGAQAQTVSLPKVYSGRGDSYRKVVSRVAEPEELVQGEALKTPVSPIATAV